MINDILLLIWVYLITWGLQLISWPWLFHFNKKLSDFGWAIGRVVGSLVVAFIIWNLAHLKLPVNNEVGVVAVFLLLLYFTWQKKKKEIKPAFLELKKIRSLVICEELLFISGFVIYALVRGFQPDILGLEKFMDFGFIKSYLSTATLPAPDMWWAGSPINYYSFGHFWTSILIRIWGVPADIGYNLMLAFLLASSLAITFSVIVNLFPNQKLLKVHLAGGFLGSLLVVLGGNSHTLWSLLSKGTLKGYWYADATRFIFNTIHEFPSYSFVVSDLHGHVLGLPIILTFLLFFIAWGKVILEKEKISLFDELVIGWLLGLMAMTNTWDILVYGLLLSIFGLLIVIRGRGVFFRLLRSAVIMGGVAFLTALFWVINFQSISGGVAAVSSRSPIWQLLVLWTIHISVTLAAMAFGLVEKKTNLLILAIALAAISLILIPEFIYVKDIYPNHPRANTMFKLTYQAFIMMGLLFGFVFAKIAELKKYLVRFWLGMVALAAFFSLMIFPIISFSAYYAGFSSYRGLSGFYFLRQRFPDDLRIIDYLDKNRSKKTMVESPGDSYTETDFVSAFSGVPTVVGWRVHEWLWRGGYDQVGKRDEEVRGFYEDGDQQKMGEFIEKYKIGWVMVSKREREKYNKINENLIRTLGEVITFGESYLMRVR